MERVGTIIGSGIGGIETIETEHEKCVNKGPDRVSPMYIPMGISNMATGNVAIDLGAKRRIYGNSNSMCIWNTQYRRRIQNDKTWISRYCYCRRNRSEYYTT